MPDDTDWANTSLINVGYNDSYEMRSEKINKHYFSLDPAPLELKLRKRKEELVREKYTKLIKEFDKALKSEVGNANNAIERKGIDCPW